MQDQAWPANLLVDLALPLATSPSTRVPSAACVVLAVCAAALGQASATAPAPANKSTPKSHVSPHTSSKKSKKSRKSSWRRGQQKIDPARAREIQEALVREHYLDSPPSNKWDDASQKAMERYQADNGWQSKSVPDSRALIKLGLGPDHEHLLNPESAMTSVPQQPKPSAKSAVTAISADPPAEAKPPQK